MRRLFLEHAGLFASAKICMLMTIPVAIAHSAQGVGLPFQTFGLHDVPVFDRNHRPDETSRARLLDLVHRRVPETLFEPGTAVRLVVASGGDLRQLFAAVQGAAEEAAIRKLPAARIDAAATAVAVSRLKREALLRLGEQTVNKEVTLGDKIELLKRVYESHPGAMVPSPAPYSLLRARVSESAAWKARTARCRQSSVLAPGPRSLSCSKMATWRT